VKEGKVLAFVALKQMGFGPMSRLFTVLIHDACFNILRLPKIRLVSARLHYSLIQRISE
jgi:hypothetical protein